MTEDTQKEKSESLGEYLRNSREEKGLSFDELQQLTKIPPKSLRAMEEDDYDTLPANAFARGFYMLYARNVKLDSEDVLRRFDEIRGTPSFTRQYSSPTQQGKQVNTMAARPSMTRGAIFGFLLVLLVAVIALLSWYFSWNPAAYISDKLQGFQQEEVIDSEQQASPEELGVTRQTDEEPFASNYFLTVDFQEDTAITVTIDNGLPEKEIYTKGSTRSWYADEKISIILPASAEVELLFNGNQVSLPQPQDGMITLTLP